MFLKKGMQNQNVRGLQEKLNELGFDAGPADGIFGPRTERAVMAFQTDKGLSIDGVVG
jgi:peptidoglycan hydrolase-like protein with peptidoglycan-binding domain